MNGTEILKTMTREDLRQGARLVRVRDGMTGAAYDVEPTKYGPRLLVVLSDRTLASVALWDTASLQAYEFGGTVEAWRDWLHEAKTAEQIAEIEKEMRAAAKEQRRAAYLAEFGEWLEPAAGSKKSGAALAASNIRRELARAFPGVVFSVRSRSFAGGDAVDISWQLGPTTKEVDAIAGKYEPGSFDGMDDCYKYDSDRTWPELFGSAKYVQAQRDWPRAEEHEKLMRQLAELCGVEWRGASYTLAPSGYNLSETFNRAFFAQSFPAGAVITGIEHAPADSEASFVFTFDIATDGSKRSREALPAEWTVEARKRGRCAITAAISPEGRVFEFVGRNPKGATIRQAVEMLAKEEGAARAQQWTATQPHELAEWEASAIEAAFSQEVASCTL
jgi:hypothetical protein